MKSFYLILFVLLISVGSRADNSGKCGENVTYTFVNGTLTIEGNGTMENYQRGYYTAPWKNYRESIHNIVIKEGVSSIGSYAFMGCTNLTSFILSSSVKNIGTAAFWFCTSLISATMPDGLASIGDNAFDECSSLTSISIPSSVSDIGNYAFCKCESLNSIIIPNGVKSIGAFAFDGCTSLNSLTIPSSVTFLGNNLSNGIKKIIWLPNTPPTNYLSAGGVINYVSNNQYHINKEKAKVYPFLSSFFEVNGVKYVPVSPSERICDAIDCVYDSSISNINITSSVIYNGISMTVQKTQPYLCYGNNFIETIAYEIDGRIEEYAFADCKNLKQVTLGDNVSAICNCAFQNCSSLHSLIIPKKTTELGEYSFSGCKELQTISIPKSVTTIQNNVFDDCISLREMIIEDRNDELKLGYSFHLVNSTYDKSTPLFSSCPLDSVYIGGNITYDTSSQACYSPFYRNPTLRTVVITDKETVISDNMFYGCTNLQDFSIGDGVEKFGDWAFSGCSNLKSLSFGSQLKTIGKEAFSDCISVTKISSKAAIPPVCSTQALDDINKWNCTLYVPKGCLSYYQGADQWKDFFYISEVDNSGDNPIEHQKCEKPTISYQNGKLTFHSASEGAICHSIITDTDITSYDTNEVQLGVTYNISVYASKSGYENSETATATLCWIDVDPKAEGITNSVANVRANPVLIQSNGNVLNVSGTPEGAEISIFNLSGQKVGSARSVSESTDVITSLKVGEVCIVKIGDKSVKVLLK